MCILSLFVCQAQGLDTRDTSLRIYRTRPSIINEPPYCPAAQLNIHSTEKR